MTESHKHYRESDPMKDPRIVAELAEGEELVWAGRPVVWLRLPKSVLTWFIGVPLTVVCAMFLKQFVGGPIGGTDTEFHPVLDILIRIIFGIAALLMGLCGVGFLLYPLAEYRASKSELFVLTSRRCLVWCRTDGDFGAKSLGPEQLTSMHREIDGKGRGNLVLGPDPSPEFDEDELEEERRTVGFRGIERVREVEQLIRETLGVAEDNPEEEAL